MHALEGSEDSKNSERPDHRLALARRISTTKDNNNNNNNNKNNNIVNNYRSLVVTCRSQLPTICKVRNFSHDNLVLR